jgi:hypothetical protein
MHPTFLGIVCLAAAAAAAWSSPAAAMNRCVTPEGRVIYTDSRCEFVGARPHGQVRDSLSVVPSQDAPQTKGPAQKRAGRAERNERATVFRKSPNAPRLTICYDARNARADTPLQQMESAIASSAAQWNTGCNVNYQYIGPCPADEAAWQRERPDYRVAWATWDDSLMFHAPSQSLARDHAIARAGPALGVELNRDISVPPWRLQRAIAHEFGHVAGVLHSNDSRDLMYSGGNQRGPTAADYEMCNRAIEARYGVKTDSR